MGSFHGKPLKTLHLENIICSGDESSLTECSFTRLSLSDGKKLLPNTDVAGVDCIYDRPAPPPCITNNDANPTYSCTAAKGSIRLVDNNGAESTNEGRVEYCNGQYWTPLCTMDNRAAAVACRQLGHTQYQCIYNYAISMGKNVSV